jgi:hypothetical protein
VVDSSTNTWSMGRREFRLRRPGAFDGVVACPVEAPVLASWIHYTQWSGLLPLRELVVELTLNVQALSRFRQRVQGAADLPAVLRRLWESHATRDLRHSSQLENWVRRVTTRVCIVCSQSEVRVWKQPRSAVSLRDRIRLYINGVACMEKKKSVVTRSRNPRRIRCLDSFTAAHSGPRCGVNVPIVVKVGVF